MNAKRWKGESTGTHVASAAVEECRRVTIDADGKIAHTAAGALGDGVTLSAGAIGEEVTVRYFNTQGTLPIATSEATAVGADLYAAADGKVSDLPAGAGTYYKVGKALTATTADGGVTECLPTLDAGNSKVVP